MSCLRCGAVRCGRHQLEDRGRGPGGLPGLWPYIACRPAKGLCLASCQSSCQSSCQLPEREGRHCLALMGARQCLYREGSGLAVGCSGQSLKIRMNKDRAGGPADYACRRCDRAERTQLICPSIISPGLLQCHD